MKSIHDLMTLAPVIPVLMIDDVAHAQSIAASLVAGGLPIIEVTLRTPCALEAIRLISEVDGAIVGAGTVCNTQDLEASLSAGAQFIVSPGLTEMLSKAATRSNVPFLPGVATASDIMRGLEFGLDHFKFFPASTSGGPPALKALCGPFRGVHFCPTGGITQQNASDWLSNPQVLCVGGTWLVEREQPDPARIRAAAATASGLRRPI
ncbi:MAG: bifunctional 4-hydroxy-2-oxoglutarate aldolase/2-dehydro-3-deoxy-phosphogluconate aldolase [Gammaproteobacteria bacterium]|jgi:2-dehydro-3-deoxyphosphogluconate aldolase/(4S)-4-hydroxy-2-oxoglutarate aldolase|nr:bifunctional 4-hydroxy-2-oxoglutarate aldolase/2-dehydro-3-deoxy-phosphogluconate aldolase [Gammaproteobacteria bacterium]